MHGITATPEKTEKTACDKYEVSLFQGNLSDCVAEGEEMNPVVDTVAFLPFSPTPSPISTVLPPHTPGDVLVDQTKGKTKEDSRDFFGTKEKKSNE